MRGWSRAISASTSPGNPTVVVRNMQGAGSVVAANYIFNVSPKDGPELGLFAGNIIIDPLIGGTQHKYDARKFNWIGAPSSDSNVCLSSPKTHVQDPRRRAQARDDHRHVRAPRRSISRWCMNNVIGAKFKLVKGYAGSAALRLAMERGEIEGFCGVGYNSMRTAGLHRRARPTSWCRSGCRRIPHMPKVPFIFDYAKTDAGPADLPAGVRLARSRTADRGAAGHAGGPRAGAARRRSTRR